MIADWKRKFTRTQRLEAAAVRQATVGLNPEDLKMLKQICTVNVPEQKNDKGEVTQKAYSYINKNALIGESRNAIALAREARILMGKRKRSTGRHSKRKAHRAALNLLAKRLEEHKAQESAAQAETTPEAKGE